MIILSRFVLNYSLFADLFHKVILQSGTAISPWVMGISDNGLKLAEQLQINIDDQQEMMNELQNKNVEDILAGARSIVAVSCWGHIHIY